MSDPYYAQDDEYGLIGACLTGGPDVCYEVFARIPPDAIQQDKLRQVYEITKALIGRHEAISLQTVVKEWKRSIPQLSPPFEELNRCDEICASPANYPEFAKAVLEAHHRRYLD